MYKAKSAEEQAAIVKKYYRCGTVIIPQETLYGKLCCKYVASTFISTFDFPFGQLPFARKLPSLRCEASLLFGGTVPQCDLYDK